MNFKRLLRDFKSNLIKNLTFILLVTLSVTIIVGFNRSMDSYLQSVYRFREECNMEDGQFSLYTPLSNNKLHRLQSKYQMTIEEYKQVNIDLTPDSSATSTTLRVMCLDKTIDQAGIVEGTLPADTYEIALDPKFAKAQGYTIGDTITLSHINYLIVGYAISPDYTYTLEESSDFLNNPTSFGVGYVTDTGFTEIEESDLVTTTYVYLDPYQKASELKEYLNDHAHLAIFLPATDNLRITTVINDVNSPKVIALLMGLLLVMIIAFMISISIKNTIASESQTIGVLYSQGFTKRELLSYYSLLPCLLVVLGILTGYPLGVAMSGPLLFIADAQYTIPSVVLKDTPFIFFAGVFLPLALSLIITYIALSSALNKTPISLLRGQHASNHVSKFEKRFTFKHFSFFKRFRLKDMIRERSSMISLFLGVFIAIFILLTGFFLQDSTLKYIADLKSNIPYDYMYTFKSVADLDKYSKQGEQIALNSFKMLSGAKLRNVSLYGIQPNSDFFNIPELNFLKEDEVLMAPCMNAKFNIQVGDTITLFDNTDNQSYSMKVVGYAYYDLGQYFYTSVANYNSILGKHQPPYTTLLTHTALDVDSDKVLSLVTKGALVTSANNILSMLSLVTGIMITIGMVVLIIVIYLLMNMILEKSSINISMVKIFGYVPKEINKLYLNGNVVLPILGFIPAVPAAYWLCKNFFDLILAEMDNYIGVYLYKQSLAIAFFLMLAGYWLSTFLLKRKINKIALTEALKNRE